MTAQFKFMFRSIIFTTLLLISSALNAAEVITNFHSKIVVEDNGDLLVTEKITVIAEGNKIRRGIFRDFPILIEDAKGKEKQVLFDVLSIKRDGKTENWREEGHTNYIRLYIGDADVFITRGLHNYEITYRTDRQLRFFENHDELIWNVTGTEWDFPINNASARVIFPAKVNIIGTNYFTGRFGSKATFASSKISSSGKSVFFQTTKPLGARAGLTVGIKFKKGSFVPFPDGKKSAWFWRDYIGEIAGLIALAVVSLYYFVRWWQIGRDPPTGIVVPNWDTKGELSPALVNYIDEKGFGSSAWKAMTAALLNLAVKGYVIIEQLDEKPTITRTDKLADDDLPTGERVLVDILDSRENRTIKASKNNGTSIKSMQSKFNSAITQEHRSSFYQHNWGSIIFGAVLSVLAVIAVFITGGVGIDIIAVLFPLIITTAILSMLAFNAAKIFRQGKSLVSKFFTVIFSAFFVFSFISGGVVGLSQISDFFSQPLLLICLVGILILNLLFFFLMGAPTSLGREKMDVMDGLKTYLVLAEKDRMNLAGAPKMSPQHYETLLPFAVALGVEKPWSNAFQSWLLTATAAAAGYAVGSYGPGWYRGNFDSDNIGDTLGGMADNLASSFTESLPTPKSSSSGFSGGGGGFSGGGGGGGGGGGW